MRARAAGLLLSTLSAACAPSFDDQPYVIQQPRLIAVVAEPPEVRPRAELSLTPTIAGRATNPSLKVRFCEAPPPPGDPRAASETCLRGEGSPFEALEAGGRVTMPADACSRFGPNPVGGELVPRDADATGGFYQPIVVEGVGPTAVALLRVTCPLPDAPVALARELQITYPPNENPRGLRLEKAEDGAWHAIEALRAGVPNELRVTWEKGAREPYVWLPPDGRQLEARREGLRLSWFVSAGELHEAVTSRAEADGALDSRNVITPPVGANRLELWVVAHDDRGGTAVLRESLPVDVDY